VVFMHNPNSFSQIPAHAAPLAVAAHTHGGQIRIPFTPEWSWLAFFRSDEVHADGWIDAGFDQPGNRLYDHGHGHLTWRRLGQLTIGCVMVAHSGSGRPLIQPVRSSYGRQRPTMW
jgi:hypothetical protein